jgi:hypothetical protein
MSTALVPITQRYPVLAPTDEMKEAWLANNVPGARLGEHDMPRFKVPSGGNTIWMIPNPGGKPIASEEVVGIWLDWGYRGYLWPYVQPSGTKPYLLTHDAIHAYRVGDKIGDLSPEILEAMLRSEVDAGTGEYHEWFDWVAPEDGGSNLYAAWGSGHNGYGKRIKEYMRLVLLLPGNMIPTVLNVPPGSLGAFKQMQLALRNRGKAFYQFEIKMSLDCKPSKSGTDFAQIKFELGPEVPPDQLPEIKRLRATLPKTDPRDAAALIDAQASQGRDTDPVPEDQF